METKLNLLEVSKTLGEGSNIELINFVCEILQDNSTIFLETLEIKNILHKLCSHYIQGHMQLDPLIACLIKFSNLHSGIPSLLVDLLFILDIETLCLKKGNSRKRFITLVSECNNNEIIPESLLKERLEFDTIKECHLSFKKLSPTKFIKAKTKLYYKQHKFNLFCQESEGYSKLIAELNQDFGLETDSARVINVIKSLIGCFNLDPNRVCDIILECFEHQIAQEDFFIDLLQKFGTGSKAIPQLMGFKFSFYNKPGKKDGESEEALQTLYKLTAILMRHKILKLEQMYNQLSPKESEIIDRNKQQIEDAKYFARKYNFISLAVKSDGKDSEESPDKNSSPDFTNQKLGVFTALIEIGDCNNIMAMLDRLPEFYAVSFPSLATRLCNLIHYIIEPLYSRYKLIPESITSASPLKIKCQQVTTIKEFSEYSLPLVLALGPYLHVDRELIVKILGICKGVMAERPNHPENFPFHIISMLDQSLLPSLSLIKCDSNELSEEFWGLIRLFPYHQRFCLYSRWKNETYLNQPLLIRAKAKVLKMIKYEMKRLSKDNVKPTAISLGKISCSSPGFLFDYILSKIQLWDNLIVPVVDSLKYLSSLSYDVLSYCLVEALSNPAKEQMKRIGISISPWLQSLANFCGAIYKKYPIDLVGILHYVVNQLKQEKSIDLIILKEIIQQMAGIEILEEMTLEQLETLAGGKLLRSEGAYFNQVRNIKIPSLHLKEALLEHDLAIPLCLLIAQQRNCIVYQEPRYKDLKLVSQLYDQCQDTLIQFVTFLTTNLDLDEFKKHLPSLASLLSDYHIQPDVAFFLSRPILNNIQKCKFEELNEQEKSPENIFSTQKLQTYAKALEQIYDPIIEQIRSLFPIKVWKDLSPQLYMTFWSLSLYDLQVPFSSYQREINKYEALIKQPDKNFEMLASKRKQEKERCQIIKDRLVEEERYQIQHCGRMQAHLEKEKEYWFLTCAKTSMMNRFLQLCILPRCKFSKEDSLYCVRFIHLLHTLKTLNFSTIICFDRIFFDITLPMISYTENEASRYGSFLCGILEIAMKWHSKKEIYEKECGHYPGFLAILILNNKLSNSSDFVEYENYQRLCYKWHCRMFKAFLFCLNSKDYVHKRNSLVVMNKILPFFPTITLIGEELEKTVERLKAEEKEGRPDLFAIATMYAGQLNRKKSSLVPKDKFVILQEKPAPEKKTTSGDSDTEHRNTPSSSRTTKSSSASTGETIIADNKSRNIADEPQYFRGRETENRRDLEPEYAKRITNRKLADEEDRDYKRRRISANSKVSTSP